MKTIVLKAKNMKPYSHGCLKIEVYDDIVLSVGKKPFVVNSKGRMIPLVDVVKDYQIPALSNLAKNCMTYLDFYDCKDVELV
jgi:hypothetical protein